MKRSCILTLTLGLCLLVMPDVVTAAPCAVTPLGQLLGVTCTIGDKTFTFDALRPSSNLFSANQFSFVPDSSNPLAPSFTIQPVTAGSITVTNNTRWADSLDFRVATTSGLPTMIGLDVTVRGSVSGGTPTSSAGGGTVVDAANESLTNALMPLVFPEACIQSGGGFSGCVPTSGAGSASSVGVFIGGPLVSETGRADWELFADATGTAVFSSATYSFDQTAAAVPEPSSLLLLASGVSSLVFGSRRIRRIRHYER